LSKMPFEEQLRFIKDVCSNAQWSEVILALCYMTRRPAEIQRLVETLREYLGTAHRADTYLVERLMAEIAFGQFSCPTPLAREIADNIFGQIETGDWMSQRIALTRLVLGGLRSTALRDIVRDRISCWFPCHSHWRSGLLEALSSWRSSPQLLESLWKN